MFQYLVGHERFDRAFAIADQLQGHRLDAAGAQAATDLVPEQRADLVTDKPVEDAARALRGHHLLVDGTRMVEGVLNGLLGDFVEGQPVNLALLALQFLNQVPADGLALAVGVGRDVNVRRVFRGLLELLDDLLARFDGFVLLGEVVVDVHTQLALGQIADVTHRRDDLVVAAEIFVDGLRLRRRLDHDERFSHGC